MRRLSIASELSCAADGNSTIVDLNAQNIPFVPGYTSVVAFSFEEVADTIVTLQEGDESDLSDAATVTQIDLTGESARNLTAFREATITKRYVRVNNNEVTTGAGQVSVDLLGN